MSDSLINLDFIQTQDKALNFNETQMTDGTVIYEWCKLSTREYDERKQEFELFFNQLDLTTLIIVEKLEPRPTTMVADLKSIQFIIKRLPKKQIFLLFHKNENLFLTLEEIKKSLKSSSETLRLLDISGLNELSHFLEDNILLWNTIKDIPNQP